MRRLWSFCLLFLPCLPLSATSVESREPLEVIREWRWETGDPLHTIQFVSDAENHFTSRVNTQEKTPDGENTLECHIDTENPNAAAHAKQINFRWNGSFQKNKKYRMEFWCKGTVEGSLNFNAAQALPPYKPLGKAGAKISVSEEWQKASVDFFPSENWQGEAALPRVMFAHYPAGEFLFLGPVRVSVVEDFLPLNLAAEWKVFLDTDAKISHAPYTSIPDTVPGDAGPVTSFTAALQHDVIDLAALAQNPGPNRTALLFNEFESPADGDMQLGVSADWWMEIEVNGKPVFDTIENGNTSNNFLPEDHVFNFRVRKGKNLLAVKVKSGAGGWKFAAGPVPFRQELSAVRTILPGKAWKAVDMEKMSVKPGTALDLSGLSPRTPAGANGRVMINSAGHLAFANLPEQFARFLSFNFSPNVLINASKEEIDAFAATAALQGYNMIRLHYPENLLMGNLTTKKRIGDFPIPETSEKIPFNREGVDRFDYLAAALKARGIYINLDALSGVSGYTDAYPYFAPQGDKRFKFQLLVNPAYRANWRAGLDYVLNHENPYLNGKLASDPVLANLEFFNEQDFQIHNKDFQKAILPAWRDYLKAKYGTVARLREAWGDAAPAAIDTDETFSGLPPPDDKLLRRQGAAAHDGGDFLIGLMREMTSWYNKTVRELGYPGLVTQWDMIMRVLEIPARAMMPVIAQHTYFSHPSLKAPSIKTPKKNKIDGHDDRDILISQGSSLNSSYFRAAAATRFIDRPFMITEYSHSAPNRYRHERGLYFGSYAALQGWDALTAHGRLVSDVPEPVSTFERWSDPISRASEVVTAFVWLRGDVKESPHTLELQLESKSLFPDHYITAVGDDYAQAALLTKMGIAFPEVKPLLPVGKINPDITLKPSQFSPLEVTTWYVSAGTSYGNNFPPLVDALRKKSILPEANLTDPKNRIYQSDTGELTLHSEQESLTVVTPRLEGAILKENKPITLGAASIGECSVPASIALVALDQTTTLATAKRLLLVFATDALNTGTVFANPYTITDIGSLPILMQTGTLSLTFKTKYPRAKVYALNLDGSRAEEIPVTPGDSILTINIDTSKLSHATPFFEIDAGSESAPVSP